jgi:hypothetical protein
MMVWINVHIDIQLLAALCGTRLVNPISGELRVTSVERVIAGDGA